MTGNESFIDFIRVLEKRNVNAMKIHVILDNKSAYTDQKFLENLKGSRIVLNYLPTYKSEYGPIGRARKIMNELVRNNVFFQIAREFRDAIKMFFDMLWNLLIVLVTILKIYSGSFKKNF